MLLLESVQTTNDHDRYYHAPNVLQEAALERNEAFNSNEVNDFSHLDEESQEYEQEYLEARISAADDDSPSHIDEGSDVV